MTSARAARLAEGHPRPAARDHTLKAVVLGALAVAAVAARAESGVVPSRGPWSANVGHALTDLGPAVAALGAAVVLSAGAALTIALTRRRRRRGDDRDVEQVIGGLSTWGQRLGAALLALTLVGVGAGVVLAARTLPLTLTGGANGAGAASAPTPSPAASAPAQISPQPGAIGFTVIIAAALVVGVVAVWSLLRARARREPMGARHGGPAAAAAVAAAVEALQDGDARTAILGCYAALERGLAEVGVPRRPADAPQDLLARARLTSPAARELADLFREARFSSHPMTDRHSRRAERALAQVRDQLREDR